MKNQVPQMVNGLVDALFEDIALTDLVDSVSLIRSRNIIAEATKDRGFAFMTITLPSASKYLEKSLEDGWLGTERPPYHRSLSYSDDRPAFLHGLWSRLFDTSGRLVADPCAQSVFYLRQVYNLFKKIEMPCAQEYTDTELDAWESVERELPPSHPGTWDSENPVWSQRVGHPLWGNQLNESPRQGTLELSMPAVDIFSYDWSFFRKLCLRMNAALGEMDIWAIRPKHGPGAVSERGELIKYELRSWPRKLNAVFPADYFASHDLSDRTDDDREHPARMCAVPKTQKGPRLIAAEPSAHQWIQGGIQRWLEDRVKSTFLGLSIDFRNQEYSKGLALEASSSGRFATVDLSAASDRLCTRLVEYVFQGHHVLLDALHASRSRSLVIPGGLHSNYPKDRHFLLRKFAPMGSACTFPIQTIVFTMFAHFALCEAEQDWDLSSDGFRRRATSIRVFGDDIILSVEAYGHLQRMLTACGLKVNEGKSFSKGAFREACGMDAYRGNDVTPAYIRKLYKSSHPEALASVVECSNNFHRKGLWRTANMLLKTVDAAELKLLAVNNQAVGPVSVFTFVKGPLRSRKRWNGNLHNWEYRILTLSGKVSFTHGTGEASLLQFFTEEPDPMLPWAAGQAKRTRLRKTVAWVQFY